MTQGNYLPLRSMVEILEVTMPDSPENSVPRGLINPNVGDLGRVALLKRHPKLHKQTRQALLDLFDALGHGHEKSGKLLAFLYTEQWTEGVSAESGQRIENWLDELAANMLAGSVKSTLHVKKILSDWQRGLSARLQELDHHWHSRFPHLESRSLCAKAGEAGTVARFVSSYPMLSHEDNTRMKNFIAQLALPADESYRLIVRMIRRKDICDENRERLIDALMRRPDAHAATAAQLGQVFRVEGDLDAFLAYAAQHSDNPAWLQLAQIMATRRVPAPARDMAHAVSAAILDAKRKATARDDFESSLAPLKALYRKMGDGDIAAVLRTVLDACDGPEDAWLYQLFRHVSGTGPQGGFKARLRQALKKLTGHDRAEETLRMALFRYALHADLLLAAAMLCRDAGPEIDLDACLDEAVEQTRHMTVNPEAVRIVIAGMTPKQRGRAVAAIRSGLDPDAIGGKEKLLRKKDCELLHERMFMHMVHPPFLPSKAHGQYAEALRREISRDLEREKTRQANLALFLRVAQQLAGEPC